MEFTNQEIMFLTSVSRGRMPFGISVRRPLKEEEEIYVKETMKSLQQKGILDEKERLTEEGIVIIHFWEKYRNCNRHITFNDVRAALLPEGKIIMVTGKEENYDIRMIMPEIFMYGVLKNNDFLCIGGKDERGKWQDMDVDSWQKQIGEMDGSIFLSEYIQGKKVDEKIYCWKDKDGYLLNVQKKRVRVLSSSVMRRQIYRVIKGRD